MTAEKSSAKTRRWQTYAIALVIFLVAGAGLGFWVDRSGWAFFHAGEEIVLLGGEIADALEARDLEALATFHADEYQGRDLGLTRLELRDDRDGIRHLDFTAGEGVDKAGAVSAWGAYLDGFESIEEVGLHVHRMESWGRSGHVAVLRFELIGQPVGEPRSGIDRAFLRARFVPSDAGLRIAGAELVRGHRSIAAQPHFVDVAVEAGVDFENRYYPPFLTEDLVFVMLRFGPAGISTFDLDDDGWYDLFIPDGERSRMFLNKRDGSFEDVTDAVGLDGQDGVSVAIFADVDNDGDKDAFISRTFTPNRILRNDDGVFVDVTESAGIDEDCCTTVASWGDIDNDGDLDLYVGRYLDPRLDIPTTFYARNGEPNSLYLNNGDWTFTNITESAGVGELGLCLGTVFGDYDNDGDADLYVVNDFGRKTLYRNEGDLTFTDVTVETGTLAYGAGMSASFGDYDNDQNLDIYVAHIRSEHGWFAEAPTVWRYMLNSWLQGVWISDMPLYLEIFQQSGFQFIEVFQQMASGNTLLRNKGDGTFEDTTWGAEANPPGWFWGSGFIDFDNDGWLDLYSANGWIYGEPDTEIELGFLNNVVSKQDVYKTGVYFDPDNFDGASWHGHERNRHMRSRGKDAEGNVVFEEIGRAAGTDLLLNSRGIAVADFWNRGVLDMAVAASTDRHALLRNEVGTKRNWIGIDLRGAGPDLPDGTNRDAVGARVKVHHQGRVFTREIASGDGYSSQNSLRQVIGLGGERPVAVVTPAEEGAEAAVEAGAEAPLAQEITVEKIEVFWPRSGKTQTFENVVANRTIRIVEGESAPVELIFEGAELDG